MELTIQGRNVPISERFKAFAQEKLAKVEHLAQRGQRLDVKVSQQPNARQASSQLNVELTVLGVGPVIRAESQAGEKYAAFTGALDKLLERLRRAKDKKKIHHGRHPQGLRDVSAQWASGTALLETEEHSEEETADQSSSVLIRKKMFPAVSMSIDDAVDNMELIGHDFYLFIDEDTQAPSVVYRRRGWSYGVISLTDGPVAESAEEIRAYRGTAGVS